MELINGLKSKDVEIEIKDKDGELENIPLHFFSKDEFNEEQIGYREDEEGNSFVGNNEGDWQESWFVIGYHEDLGDPFFIDVNNKNYPVYTAEHGMGDWEPTLIFTSLEELLKQVK